MAIAIFLGLNLALAQQTARAQTGSVGGAVTYYGDAEGTSTIRVSLYTDTQQAPLQVTAVTQPGGPYAFNNLDDDDYYVFAYLDLDGSGGAPDAGEPFAWHDPDGDGYADPVSVVGDGTVTGVDIALYDPWRPLDGLVGQVNALAVHPALSGTLYAAVGVPKHGGGTQVYRSADGAASWQAVYTDAVHSLNGLAVTGTLAYAVGEDVDNRALILRGQGDGGSWTRVFTGGAPGALRAVAFSPKLSTTVYAAGGAFTPSYVRVGVVYRSQDGGVSWTPVLTVPAGAQWIDFHALAVNPVTPTILYVGGYESDVAAQYAVVYRSADGGTSWTRVLTAADGPGQQFTDLLVHPLTPTLVYAGSQVPKYVYRATDGGLAPSSWTSVRYDRGFRLGFDPPNTIYATDDWRELDYSAQGGISGTWTTVGGLMPGEFRSFAVDDAATPGVLYLGARIGGVYRSADGGQTWQARNDGLEVFRPEQIVVDPQNRDRLLVAGGPGGGFVSADGGRSWSIPGGLERVHAFAAHPTDSSVILAAGQVGEKGAILRSADGGANFTRVYTGAEPGEIYALGAASSNPNVMYAGGRNTPGVAAYALVLRSADGGLSWSEVYTLADATVEVLAVDPLTDQVAYVGGQEDSGLGFIERTTDGGTTWARAYTPPNTVHAIEIDPQKPHVLYATDENNVYKSVDGGDSWVSVQAYAELNPNVLAIDPRVPSHVYLGGPGYIAETVDGGRTWSDWGAPLNQGVEGRSASALAVDGGAVTQTLYAGLGGVWRYTRLAPQPGVPVTITLTPEPPQALVGQSVDVGVLVVDAHENWVVDGTRVTFTVSAEATFAAGDTVTRTTSDGSAAVSLVGVTTGTATLTAMAGTAVATTTVEFGRQLFGTERVVGGLSQPTAIDWAPDGTMFIAHQDGRVLVYTNSQVLPAPFIDLSDEVNNNWNRGMLGIAVHPSFPITPHVYLLYTYDPPGLPGYDFQVDGRDGNGSRVSRMVRVSAYATNTLVANPASKVVVLGKNSTLANIGDPADPGGENLVPACDDNGTPITDCLPSEGPSHSIGWVDFAYDGSLFVSNGEGAPYITPDPRADRAQNLDSLGGKILRIDPETGQGYPDNPFYDGDLNSNRSKVWAYGLRNPFRFALDPLTHTFYAGDVGWFSWEELNGGVAENFGWPCYEGGDSGNERHPLYQSYTPTLDYCGPLYDNEPDNGVQAPLHSYQNVDGAAIVAGAIYTGTQYPSAFHGKLFLADYDNRWIKYVTFDGGGNTAVHDFLENISGPGTGPVQLTLGPDGYLYYVVLNADPEGDSEVRRVRYTSEPTAQAGASPTNGYPPLLVNFSSAGSSDPNAGAGGLTYRWSFGDGVTSSLPNPSHTYTFSDTFTAVLTVTNGLGAWDRDSVVVVVGDSAPLVTITAPISGSTYVMSGSLPFAGTAVDVEDGVLPTDTLRWTARLYFNEHFHSPFFQQTQSNGGTLVIPSHNDNTSVVLCLTAEDSVGLQGRDCVEIFPQTAVYTFTTVPSGLQLFYEGAAYTTPFTIPMIVNAQRSVEAPLWQDGRRFLVWSDGGARSHVIEGQATPRTYEVLYAGHVIQLPLVLRNHAP